MARQRSRSNSATIQSLLLSLLALAVCPVERVSALQCYACSSLNDPNCWNVAQLSASSVQGCEDLYYACTTRVTTMEGFTFIGRNCLPKGICENTINVEGAIEDRCVTCSTDFCNTGSGASAIGRSVWSLAPVSAMALVTAVRYSATWQ